MNPLDLVERQFHVGAGRLVPESQCCRTSAPRRGLLTRSGWFSIGILRGGVKTLETGVFSFLKIILDWFFSNRYFAARFDNVATMAGRFLFHHVMISMAQMERDLTDGGTK